MEAKEIIKVNKKYEVCPIHTFNVFSTESGQMSLQYPSNIVKVRSR